MNTRANPELVRDTGKGSIAVRIFLSIGASRSLRLLVYPSRCEDPHQMTLKYGF